MLEQLPNLAKEFVTLPCDVVLAAAPYAIRASMSATSTIPIVGIDLESEAVEIGWTKSLSHPGGKLTGVFSLWQIATVRQAPVGKGRGIRRHTRWLAILMGLRAHGDRVSVCMGYIQPGITFAHEQYPLIGWLEGLSDKSELMVIVRPRSIDGQLLCGELREQHGKGSHNSLP